MTFWKTLSVNIYGFFYYLYLLMFHGDDLKDFDKTIEMLNTPDKTQGYMNSRFTYQEDEKNWWKPAIQTWKDRGGDCEDYAIWSLECLKKLFNCFILCMYRTDYDGKHYGHAVCLIKMKDKWITLGNWGYKEHPCDYAGTIESYGSYKNWEQWTLYNEDLVPIDEGYND